MKTQTPEYLIRLRQATRQIHSAVEVLTDSERMLGNVPERSQYQQFLATHYLLHLQVAIHSACFIHLEHDAGFLDWPNCQRLHALKDDLDQLNISINTTDCPDLPTQTHGFTLGLIYVTEGSCIGNQRVLAALNSHDVFHQWNSKSFLSTCKDGFSNRWKSLQKSMEQLSTHSSPIDGSGYDELERGAISGFKLYMDYWTALDTNSSPQRPANQASVV